MGEQKKDYLLYIALDIGTSCSGYAFSVPGEGRSKDICMNPNWGSDIGQSTYKTPTSVLIGPNKQFVDFGTGAEKRYYEKLQNNEDGYHLFRTFKMELHYQTVLSEETMICSVTRQMKMPALEIFSMLIQHLALHCKEMVHKSYPGGMKDQEIKWIVTVPAIWTECAKNFMRKAVYKAGLISTIDSPQLLIALEPEAAALACRMIDPADKQYRRDLVQANIKPGDKYLVIDAGGGTIDITAHQVQSDGVSVTEIIAPNGGPWGGHEVNKKLRTILEQILDENTVCKFEKTLPIEMFKIMAEFDISKRNINVDDADSNIFITITYPFGNFLSEWCRTNKKPSNFPPCPPGIRFSENGALIITHEKAISIFEEVVEKTVNHLKTLLKNRILDGLSYVFLVGGFATSSVLKRAVESCIPAGCTLIVPPEPQLTILKGAIYFGYDTKAVRSRIAKKTYGTDVMRYFTKGKHDAKYKISRGGREWCDGVFDPFVLKGEEVKVGTVIQRTRTAVEENQQYMTIDIYCTDKSDFKAVDYVDRDHMKMLCSLYIEMDGAKEIQVSFIFGGTEMQVLAENKSTGKFTTSKLDFLS